MKVSQINYQKNFHTDIKDRFLMETLSVTVSVDDTDSVKKALALAKETVEMFHKQNNPQLFVPKNPADLKAGANTYTGDEDMRGTKTITIDNKIDNELTVVAYVPPKKLTPVESLIKSIEDCKEMAKPNGLLSYEKVAASSPKIKAVYDLQILKLTK